MDRAPETRFARSGERRIAYQVVGDGPVDLVCRLSWFTAVDSVWYWEPFAAFRDRLASFSRLIMFDRPGTRATDPLPAGTLSAVEAWSDDLLVVLDEIGSQRAACSARSTAGCSPSGLPRPIRSGHRPWS